MLAVLRLLERMLGLGGLEVTADADNLRDVQRTIQYKLTHLYLWLGLAFCAVEGTLNFIEGRPALGALIAGMAVVLLACLKPLARHPQRVATIGTAATFVLLMGGSVYAVATGFTAYLFWAFIFIPIAFALQGLKRAVLWISALGVGGLAIYAIGAGTEDGLGFSPVLIRELSIAWAVVFLLSFVFEFIREYYERLLAHLNEKLERLATTDTLTRAYNRRMMETLLEHELQLTRTPTHAFSVIIFDIDHFKRVNDTYGHQVGDEVLRAVADTTRGHVRPTDYFGRWGGEEFLVLCAGTTRDDARDIAERIRAAIEARAVGDGVCVTASFGVSSLRPGDDLDRLINRADRALYEAKDRSRNTVVVAGDPPG